jgi:hypothetical protein
MEDLDDLDDDPNEGRSDMDEWFPEDGSNGRDWVLSHPVFRPKMNAFLYVCQDLVSHIKRQIVE